MTESAQDVFARIYNLDTWTLGSGPGSVAAANKPFTRLLESFIRENSVESIVDFGCGDWQYMSSVDLQKATYIGFDVVASVLSQNRQLYSRPNVCFERSPSDLEDLPTADLLLIKDVLIHLPNAFVAKLMECAQRKYKFILTVNNRTGNAREYNVDIQPGSFRPVDLARPPFSIPCATILHYGRLRILDPRLPAPLAFALRRHVWPGIKHVQLVIGSHDRSQPNPNARTNPHT